MKVLKAPNRLNYTEPSIFLAGSIEMGKAIDWQTFITSHFTGLDVCILNPRRDDWDASWTQSITNPQFKEQVDWELDMLDQATYIFMYFDPATKSPISLLELGLYAQTGKLIVCCPNGFWRKGNVDVVCERFNVKQVETIEQAIELIRGYL
jgi:hypothetical protein